MVCGSLAESRLMVRISSFKILGRVVIHHNFVACMNISLIYHVGLVALTHDGAVFYVSIITLWGIIAF